VTVDSIFNAFWYVPTDSVLYRQNKEAVKQHLTRTRSFPITDLDWADLVWVYDQFYYWGPSITYNSGTSNSGGMPSFAEIMLASDPSGLNRGFLARESTWRWLRDMQMRNMIVPIVGDFAGPTALRSVGGWLKERNATVTAIYASNVEQYLWQDGKAYSYYNNVAQLPVDANSVFIRSNGAARATGGGSGMRAPNVICSIQQLLDQVKAGSVNSYQSIFYYCQ
jgi:hypothetical protein